MVPEPSKQVFKPDPAGGGVVLDVPDAVDVELRSGEITPRKPAWCAERVNRLGGDDVRRFFSAVAHVVLDRRAVVDAHGLAVLQLLVVVDERLPRRRLRARDELQVLESLPDEPLQHFLRVLHVPAVDHRQHVELDATRS